MDFISVVILAVIQGIAEFLPISSSAHLIIFRDIFGTEWKFISSIFMNLNINKSESAVKHRRNFIWIEVMFIVWLAWGYFFRNGRSVLKCIWHNEWNTCKHSNHFLRFLSCFTFGGGKIKNGARAVILSARVPIYRYNVPLFYLHAKITFIYLPSVKK